MHHDEEKFTKLAFHRNCGSILYHFWDEARYWPKIVIFHTACILRPY